MLTSFPLTYIGYHTAKLDFMHIIMLYHDSIACGPSLEYTLFINIFELGGEDFLLNRGDM